LKKTYMGPIDDGNVSAKARQRLALPAQPGAAEMWLGGWAAEYALQIALEPDY
jgi:hypothetical protein